jgi:hypothetical protein
MRAIASVALCAALLAPTAAAAGWGAIAYNPVSGFVAEAHGYAHLPDALNAALKTCGNGCLLVTWEQNRCIAFATGARGDWGAQSNAANTNAATAGAVQACGPGCTWRVWACS